MAGTLISAVLARVATRQRAIPFLPRNGPASWQRLIELSHAGKLRIHVERTIALEDVAAAQRDMETGHGRGKIVGASNVGRL